jgi:adenosylmethionine-8-amino-7-oxononanoate aminotransferase
MSNVFHRNPRHTYPVAVRGDGAYLIDAAGKRYLDASGGAGVSCLGHSDRAVIEAIQRQVERLPYVHTSFFTTEPMEALGDALVASAPKGGAQVYFTSGGSEAIEAALKMARQYFLEKGEPQRTQVIARRQSYHGNTLGALAVGGNALRRKPYEPLLIEATHVSPCYAYREQGVGESDAAYVERLSSELEKAISDLGGDRVIAFVAETVVGATLGAAPAGPGYFKKIREVCDGHGILLILDEVMCGMGRCGTLWAFEQEGVVPDMVTIAKGLGAGYQPIGAVVLGAHIHEAIVSGSGSFQHGTTYLGHATACAAGLAVHKRLVEDDLLQRVTSVGKELERQLRAAFAGHPHVGDIRGRGLFRALELVEDRASKKPFDPALRLHARIKQEALDAGLLCYPMGGTLDGQRGDHVLLAPPYILEPAQVDELVEKLKKGLARALEPGRSR